MPNILKRCYFRVSFVTMIIETVVWRWWLIGGVYICQMNPGKESLFSDMVKPPHQLIKAWTSLAHKTATHNMLKALSKIGNLRVEMFHINDSACGKTSSKKHFCDGFGFIAEGFKIRIDIVILQIEACEK